MCLWAVLLAAQTRTGESKENNRSAERVDRLFPVAGLPLHVLLAGSPALIIVGAWPSSEEAFDVTAPRAGVVFAGHTLLPLVMSQKPTPGPSA